MNTEAQLNNGFSHFVCFFFILVPDACYKVVGLALHGRFEGNH